jgi:eukaryotic-like serine/threonine-protein kinase
MSTIFSWPIVESVRTAEPDRRSARRHDCGAGFFFFASLVPWGVPLLRSAPSSPPHTLTVHSATRILFYPMSGKHAPEAGPKVDGAAGVYGDLGKYQLFARLGRGGQANVYLAVSRGPMRFDKLVVLKCLRPEVADHRELVTMFLDEARLAARLNHPNVVQTFEVDTDQGIYFIAMEYLDGQPLNRVFRTRRAAEAMTPATWCYILGKALAGLHYAHELADYDGTPLNIVHRDLSPHNIFVCYDGTVKLVDFGIAKASLNNARTDTGIVKGKAAYMAPEQAYGMPVDRRADVFAMGILLWEALTGTRLFEGAPMAVMLRLVSEPIPPASSVNADIAPELDAIVARAVEKKREDRYQTAAEMREALDDYLRTSGNGVRGADVGRIMAEAFKERRASVQHEVQAYMAAAVAVPSENRVKAPPPELGDNELPEISGMGTPSHVQARMRAITPPPSAAPPPNAPRARDRRIGFVVGAAAVAAVTGVVWQGGSASSRAPLTPSPLGAPAPTTSAGPTLAPSSGDRATVSLTSDPSGAIVSRNGDRLGRTPLRIDLPAAAQTLVLAMDGYEDEAVVLDLTASGGEVSNRHVTMRGADPSADGGRAQLAAHPKGASTAPVPSPPPAIGGAPSHSGSTRSIDRENPFDTK